MSLLSVILEDVIIYKTEQIFMLKKVKIKKVFNFLKQTMEKSELYK